MPFISINDPAKPCNKLDPMYHEAKRAIDITKKFIADRGLVCYGGSALDFAARLQGSKIYDDTELDLPDLDFYSIDPYKDACDLADILFQNGFPRARCIKAIHIGTFRVDCGSNHWVADVGYCPVLNELKTLKYEQMLIVDPIYQRIDMHRALSHPYDNPPQEVIFNRLKKDIERFNIINGLYPMSGYPAKHGGHPGDQTKLNISLDPRAVYTGMVAYQRFIEEPISVAVTEICSMEPDETMHDLGLDLVSHFEPYFNMLPECFFCQDSDGRKFIIYSTEDTLVSYESLSVKTESDESEIQEKKHRFSCANYVLRLLLGWYLVGPRNRPSWPWLPDYLVDPLSNYNRLLTVCRISTKTYGTKNIDHTSLVKMEEQDAAIAGKTYITSYPLPENYQPYNVSKNEAKNEAKNEVKNEAGSSSNNDRTFNYRSNILLRISGNVVE